MKIALFCDNDNDRLTNIVNEFIATHEVKDIKFSSSEKYYDIMVIYDDKDE